MRQFTLVMAYYDNPRMLAHQLCAIRDLPQDVQDHLHVRIVDDGSPTSPARYVCEGIRTRATGFPDGFVTFELWRMERDIRWNQDACRNVGVRQAQTRWLLLTDMDHVVPLETWLRLMAGKLDTAKAYRFGRVTAPKLEPYKVHPNSWAMTRETYWHAGGYDERLAGHYGTDGDFKVRVERVATREELPDVIVRYPREVIPDASTTTLTRKSDEDRRWITDAVKLRDRRGDAPLHFQTPCVRVL